LGNQYVLLPYGQETYATEEFAGVSEIATQDEVDLGVDDLRMITPLKLSNYRGQGIVAGAQNLGNQYEWFIGKNPLDASLLQFRTLGTAADNIPERGTQFLEGQDWSVILDTDTSNPDTINISVPNSNETVWGLSTRATQVEVNDGISDVGYITPLKLQTKISETPKIHPPGSTPPVINVVPGDLWFHIDLGDLFVYYDDGGSAQWVSVNTHNLLTP